MKEEIFVSIFGILLLYNIGYVLIVPTSTFSMGLGVLVGFIVTVLGIGALSGVTFMGTGLNEVSVKIIFTVASLLNLMFSIQISLFGYTLPVGLGLITNLYSSFTVNDMFGIGLMLSTVLGGLVLVSGIMIAIGG